MPGEMVPCAWPLIRYGLFAPLCRAAPHMGRDRGMARSKGCYICLPCWDESGKAAVPATHRLLVREVGKTLGDEVWGCRVHISELYAHILRSGKPLDVIVHNMVTGACVTEAHPRRVG